jgi:hypothetical protein
VHYAATKIGRGELFEALDGLSILRATRQPIAFVLFGRALNSIAWCARARWKPKWAGERSVLRWSTCQEWSSSAAQPAPEAGRRSSAGPPFNPGTFDHGRALPDPEGLLEGSGKALRHVKVRSLGEADQPALWRLLAAAIAERREGLKLTGTCRRHGLVR